MALGEMNKEKSIITLIVRGDLFGVQLDVKIFPIICPSCNKYFDELYTHTSSRYGQVGSKECRCGKTVHLTDSDNIVEYIDCHSENKTITIDFKELFQLKTSDFKLIAEKYGYDVFEKHLNEYLDLEDLINRIEITDGIKTKPVDSKIPLPETVKKWIGLKKDRR